jgi:hypothetical protein
MAGSFSRSVAGETGGLRKLVFFEPTRRSRIFSRPEMNEFLLIIVLLRRSVGSDPYMAGKPESIIDLGPRGFQSNRQGLKEDWQFAIK